MISSFCSEFGARFLLYAASLFEHPDIYVLVVMVALMS